MEGINSAEPSGSTVLFGFHFHAIRIKWMGWGAVVVNASVECGRVRRSWYGLWLALDSGIWTLGSGLWIRSLDEQS